MLVLERISILDDITNAISSFEDIFRRVHIVLKSFFGAADKDNIIAGNVRKRIKIIY